MVYGFLEQDKGVAVKEIIIYSEDFIMKISLGISSLFIINRTLKTFIRKCVNNVISHLALYIYIPIYQNISTDMNDSGNRMVVSMLHARWRP